MDVLFKNSHAETANSVDDMCKVHVFRSFAGHYCLALTTFCWLVGLYNLIVYETLYFSCFFGGILFPFACYCTYIALRKKKTEQAVETGNMGSEIVCEVTGDVIRRYGANGAKTEVNLNCVKKCFLTKDFIYIRTKAFIYFTLSRDGFSVGNEEDLFAFLKKKGVKIKR